jgi:hypothetical protein
MAPDDAPAPTRGRGRPRVGTVVKFRLPDPVLAVVDQMASDAELDRAEVLRDLIAESVKVRAGHRRPKLTERERSAVAAATALYEACAEDEGPRPDQLAVIRALDGLLRRS